MRRLATIFIVMMPSAAVVIYMSVFMTAGVRLKENAMKKQNVNIQPTETDKLKITAVFDNNSYQPGLETDWGFAAYITGTKKNILFDTGSGRTLLDNMKKLSIEPNDIDVVVLSHAHGDHTGGLDGLLEENSNVTVYLLSSMPEKFKNNIIDKGAKIVDINEPASICESVYSTGRLGILIKEQGLILKTDKGLIVITGCAHPGIVKIAARAKDLLKDDILLLMGGFHLEWTTKTGIERIISELKKLGVQYAAPCHCTGSRAKTLFKEQSSKNYIDIGVGKEISPVDLE